MSATTGSVAQSRPVREHERFDIMSVGSALSLFFLLTYVLVVIAYLVDPHMPMTQALIHAYIPGSAAPTRGQLFEGAIYAFAWAWYIAVVGVPLYNYSLARQRARGR